MKKYINTNLYTWESLGDNTYILWVRKNSRSGSRDGFIQFSYYKKDNRLCIDHGTKIHCKSFDEANFLVSKVLKCYWFDIPDEFCGRYHKLKKLQKLCHSVS